MIRVTKSEEVPSSLQRKTRYDGEDVQKQLRTDLHEKCYICERKRDTDLQIEHIKSQEYFEEGKCDWSNLLLACGYCNGRKSSSYDDMVNPLERNVEEEIRQEVDFGADKAVFTALVDDNVHQRSVELLTRLYNGKTRMRNVMEGEFWKCIKSTLNDFKRKVDRYLENPTEENREVVRCELGIDKELLGFKYWIIRDNAQLNGMFGKDIVWNKK